MLNVAAELGCVLAWFVFGFLVCLCELIVIYLSVKYWYSIVYQYVERGFRAV